MQRIGAAAGSVALYQAMTGLGHARATDFAGPLSLGPAPSAKRVLILGAGLAGMVAAYELRRAGYTVSILEFQDRVGGRNWTLNAGDRYVELGGAVQNIGFAPGNYLNPGPWRIPFHHQALLHYCRVMGVALEPFIQTNHNAYVHAPDRFGGVPQRYGKVLADYTGSTAELLAKAVDQKLLDQTVQEADREALIASLRATGALDRDLRYVAGPIVGEVRGWAHEPGAGLDGAPVCGEPIARDAVLQSGFWKAIAMHRRYEHQMTMFQPVGGMGMIGRKFGASVGDLVTHHAEVRRIAQSPDGVTVTYADRAAAGKLMQASADWCVCTLPLPILTELDIDVSPALRNAIAAVPYASSVKVGLEFKRRFWEQDEQIYGGISVTDQPITQVSYPSHGYQSDGPAVMLGAYMFGEPAYEFAGMDPDERVQAAIEQGSRIHRQMRDEFKSGASVAWSRVPWTLGCCGIWSEETRRAHYADLVTMDRRLVLAGEHASYVGCWQEGAVLSALNAIEELHKRASA